MSRDPLQVLDDVAALAKRLTGEDAALLTHAARLLQLLMAQQERTQARCHALSMELAGVDPTEAHATYLNRTDFVPYPPRKTSNRKVGE